FQAEDGIRDLIVTGVQTCALPISIIEKNELFALQRAGTIEALCGGNIATESINATHVVRMAQALEKHYGIPKSALDFYYVHAHRSEERRVGKECGSLVWVDCVRRE